MDPKADWYYSLSPCNYVANNPIILKDPNGMLIESAWDVASLGMGISSFVKNVREGNVTDAIIDGVGIVADGTALALPLIPGGAGATIKAFRATDKVIDATQTGNRIDNAADAEKAGDGVVYRRTNPKTGKKYIGQSKSEDQFVKRQASHDKAKGTKHDYEVVDRGKPGTDLDVKEETHIRQEGGPNNNSTNGTLENKRHQMNDERYKNAGGTAEKNY